MDKKKNARRPRRPAPRRLVQLYSALLHNAYLRGFLEGRIYQGQAKYACVPGLNCYSCPAAAGSCPLGALQNALASTGHRAGWYMAGILLLFGVTLGRTICGWLCPFGLIQELLHKIPVPKLRKSRATRVLSLLKYGILAVFVIAVPLWYGLKYDLPLPAFCKYICPAGTSEGALSLLAHPANASYFDMLGAVFARKLVIMLAVLLACVFCFRSFCRFVCPLGALYGLFSRFCIVGVRVDPDRCSGCGACVRSCGMDVRRVGDRECVHCGKCMDVCAKGAISLRAGRIVLKGPETGRAESAPGMPAKRRRTLVLRGAALAVLCFALLWYNVLDPSVRNRAVPAAGTETAAEDGVPAGSAAGFRLPGFTLTCYDGSEFRLEDQRGKIVFINLWATHCTPCIQELPYFDRLLREHRGDVAVIAVHSSFVSSVDPVPFVADKGWILPFATDADDTVKNIVGGAGVLPQTVVLDRNGVVVFNQVGSVTPEELAELYEKADRGADISPAAESAREASQAYVLRFVDQYGAPVPGTVVNFCTDESCTMVRSDENGVLRFEGPPAVYHVQVLKRPEGWNFDDVSELFIGPGYGEWTLPVRRDT